MLFYHPRTVGKKFVNSVEPVQFRSVISLVWHHWFLHLNLIFVHQLHAAVSGRSLKCKQKQISSDCVKFIPPISSWHLEERTHLNIDLSKIVILATITKGQLLPNVNKPPAIVCWNPGSIPFTYLPYIGRRRRSSSEAKQTLSSGPKDSLD